MARLTPNATEREWMLRFSVTGPTLEEDLTRQKDVQQRLAAAVAHCVLCYTASVGFDEEFIRAGE